MQSVCWAGIIENGQKDTANHINFLEPEMLTTKINNDISITFTSLFLESDATGIDKSKISNFYYAKDHGIFGSYLKCISIYGASIDITNNSDQIYVIQWGGSSMKCGTFSGLPFLGNMKYRDAGNPSATPDTIIPPKQTISRNVYISRIKWYDGGWGFNGDLIPIDNHINIQLYLKILDNTNTVKYFSIVSPHIGLVKN